MKKNFNANAVKTLARDLKIASSILEWEMGDVSLRTTWLNRSN
jgi:hypothetical protein